MSATYLHQLALDLLAAAEAAIDPACTGHELPARRYVSWNEPAWDPVQGSDGEGGECGSQLVAWWADTQTQVTAQGRACAIQFRGRLCVELVRCHPSFQDSLEPWPAEVYEEGAAILSADAWALLRGVAAWVRSLDCSWRQIEDVVPSGPDGGAAGVRVCVRLELNDPDPPCTPGGAT